MEAADRFDGQGEVFFRLAGEAGHNLKAGGEAVFPQEGKGGFNLGGGVPPAVEGKDFIRKALGSQLHRPHPVSLQHRQDFRGNPVRTGGAAEALRLAALEVGQSRVEVGFHPLRRQAGEAPAEEGDFRPVRLGDGKGFLQLLRRLFGGHPFFARNRPLVNPPSRPPHQRS